MTNDSSTQPDSRGPIDLDSELSYVAEEVLGKILEGVLFCDEERRVIYVNEAFTRITGYLAEDILGRSCSILQGEGTDPVTLEALRSAVRAGRSFEGEILNYRKDGTAFWNDLTISPIHDEEGRVIRFIGLQRDVTERKEQQKALETASKNLLIEMNRLRESQAVAGIGSWETNLSTMEVKWTDETFRICELFPGGMAPTHEKFLSFVHPEDRQLVDDAFTRSVGKEGSFSIEHRLVFPDGRTKLVEERWRTFNDDQGHPNHAVGTCQDITERKIAEKVTRQALQRLREAQRIAQIGDWEWDLVSQCITWSPQVFEIFGRDPALGAPKDFADLCELFDESNSAHLQEMVNLATRSNESQELELALIRPDGKEVHIHTRAVPKNDENGKVSGLSGTVQDITGRKLTMRALQESKERFAGAFEHAPIGMALVAPNGQWLKVNKVICDLVGYSASELIASTFQDITHPDDLAEDLECVRQLLDGEKSYYQIEKRYFHADGHLVTVLLSVSLVRDAQEQPLYFVCHIVDISERKLQQDALRRSQDLLRIAGQIARLGGWSIDLRDSKLNWSEEVCLIHDMEPGQTPSLDKALAFHLPEYRDEVSCSIKRCAEDGIPFTFESEIITTKQRKIWVNVTGEAVRDHGGRIVRLQGALQDISQQKQAELELFRTNRALKMLSASNEALIRAENEQDLLNCICRIAVENGGYRMAWVGYAQDDETRSIQPKAHAGFEDGYLSEVQLSWSKDNPRGCGPPGLTIRHGEIFVCADLEQEPNSVPNLEHALRRGYRSFIKLPLRKEGRTFGLLGLYGSGSHDPTADELKLLQELADNLAFGIANLHSRENTRRMQEAQLVAARRTELAARAGKVGIWEWDLVNNTLVWDEQMYALYGVTPENDQGSIELWERHRHPADIERVRAEIDEAQRPSGRPFDTQFRITHQGSGEVRTIRAQAVVFRDENERPLRMLGTNWDVTDQVEREEALRERLENEKKLRQQALAGEKAKSQFLAVMSHEIRTPMNGVLGFAEMLANSPTLTPENRELSQIIVSSGEALLRILDDILDFSRIEAGRLSIERHVFSPKELIESSQLLFKQRIHEKGLELQVNIAENLPAAVEGDPGRIRQILVNLLGNALKFTEHGSIQISCHISCEEADSQQLEFVVQDTGLGIAPERAKAVFEAFTQEDSSISRRHGGTGLGLTISRRLAELMDGSLQMTSKQGHGTVFTLRVPLLLNQQTGEEVPANAPPSNGMDSILAESHPLRVLLVEDDKINLKLMIVILARLGYDPLTAGNGAEAVATYALERPDCVLMDLQMPEMDGVEATRAIRKFEASEKLRPAFISALTANTMPEIMENCLGEGMNAYLNKPIKQQAIINTLVTASKFLRHTD